MALISMYKYKALAPLVALNKSFLFPPYFKINRANVRFKKYDTILFSLLI